MKLIYYKRRRPTIAGDYVFVEGKHKVHLRFGVEKEVDDEAAYKILGRDRDIIRQAGTADAPAPKRGRPKKEETAEKDMVVEATKDIKTYQTKDFD